MGLSITILYLLFDSQGKQAFLQGKTEAIASKFGTRLSLRFHTDEYYYHHQILLVQLLQLTPLIFYLSIVLYASNIPLAKLFKFTLTMLKENFLCSSPYNSNWFNLARYNKSLIIEHIHTPYANYFYFIIYWNYTWLFHCVTS